ncbi:MAG: hypothetical protein GX051_02930 [Clostridiales bacterium]|nr:hypothetical protein [Clostridiales bacterium]
MKRFLSVLVTMLAVVAAFFAVKLIFSDTGSASLTQPYAGADVTVADFPSSDGRLYYNNLSENAKQAYERIMAEIKTHPKEIEIPELNSVELDEMFKALCYDNPELLCMGRSCKTMTSGWSFSKRCVFIPEYSCSLEECNKRSELLGKAVDSIISGASGIASDYEKELYVHDCIVKACSYSETDEKAISAYDALVRGEAVCEGYSRAAQLLLSRMGVRNYLITGKAVDKQGDSQLHMWNVVYIDGNPYHLDVTWDDPDGAPDGAVSHTYFNLNDSEIAFDHSELEPKNPGCSDTRNNYFVKESLYFLTYNGNTAERLKNILTECVRAGENTCQIRFSGKTEYEKAVKYLIDNGEIYDILKRVSIITGSSTATDTITYSDDSALHVLDLTLSEGE